MFPSHDRVGWAALRANTASYTTALGQGAGSSNTTGDANIFVGVGAGSDNTTGVNNTIIGVNTLTGNFSGSTIIGRQAIATGNNQFVVGSAAVPAGAVTNAPAAQTHYWTIKINGTDYKVLLAV